MAKEILCEFMEQSFKGGTRGMTEWIQWIEVEKREILKIMVQLCAKIVVETDFYDTDKEVKKLIDWVCLIEKGKENNNTIRNLTGECKKLEPDCREGVRAKLER